MTIYDVTARPSSAFFASLDFKLRNCVNPGGGCLTARRRSLWHQPRPFSLTTGLTVNRDVAADMVPVYCYFSAIAYSDWQVAE
jgi:hypothetical protein